MHVILDKATRHRLHQYNSSTYALNRLKKSTPVIVTDSCQKLNGGDPVCWCVCPYIDHPGRHQENVWRVLREQRLLLQCLCQVSGAPVSVNLWIDLKSICPWTHLTPMPGSPLSQYHCMYLLMHAYMARTLPASVSFPLHTPQRSIPEEALMGMNRGLFTQSPTFYWSLPGRKTRG